MRRVIKTGWSRRLLELVFRWFSPEVWIVSNQPAALLCRLAYKCSQVEPPLTEQAG
jgi:hypothetical protein